MYGQATTSSGMMGDGRRRGLAPLVSRRIMHCTECHKPFKNKMDLIMHVEMCVVEAFENEALSIQADMPLPPVQTTRKNRGGITVSGVTAQPAPPVGVVATPAGLPALEGRVEVRLGASSAATAVVEKDPMRHAPQLVFAIKDELYDDDDTCMVAGGAASRTIEGPGGLRLVVTVEKDEGRGRNGRRRSEMDDERGVEIVGMPDGEGDGVYDDDELEMQEEEDDDGQPMPAAARMMNMFPRRQVIGALANADDEPYKPKMECPTCGLVLYRHNFATHYRIHTGELPFPCTYCDKRFRSSSAVKVHIRVHTGEKPYACPSCDYAALTKRNLDRHILNNHVRSGERKGPRSRKSRYRVENEDQRAEWTLDQLESHMDPRKDHQYEMMEDESAIEYKDHQYVIEEEEEEMGEDQMVMAEGTEEVVGEEEVYDDGEEYRESRQSTQT